MSPLPLTLLLPLALFTMVSASCSRHPDANATHAPGVPGPPAEVRVEIAARVPVALAEETVGTVRAVRRAVVEAKISGLILELPVAQGQRVAAGQSIAVLDARDIQARLDQARAQLEQARRDLERAESLSAQNALPRQELDGARAREQVARAGVSAAETQLGYARLDAPFDGVITRRLAEQGDLAQPGRPVVEIEDPTRLRLELDVSEALLPGLSLGQELPLRLPSLDQGFVGKIAEIAPVADPVSRTVRVKVDLPPEKGIRPGLFGRARIPAGTAESLLLPEAALVVRGQMEMVFVVERDQARLRLVKSGRVREGRVDILSGLAPGETVVVTGAAALRDGQSLVVKP